jgi:hypothetical protein
MKIKFHLNDIACNLNQNQLEFISMNKNMMQFCAQGIGNMLPSVIHDYGLETKINFKKTPFHLI